MAGLYDRTRQWALDAGVTDPRGQFICMVSEAGELERASDEEIAKEIGDVAFTAIVLHRQLTPTLLIESVGETGRHRPILTTLGYIAEGLGKPSKIDLARDACVDLFQMMKMEAMDQGFHFLRDCLEPVVIKNEGRLGKGRLIDGRYVKEEDL